MENEDLKNIEATLKFENLSIDQDTKNIINYYFDGKFTSDEMISYVKQQYNNYREI